MGFSAIEEWIVNNNNNNIIADNQMLKVKYAFNLETQVYVRT